MKRITWLVMALALMLPWDVSANDELLKLQNDDSVWVIPGKNYASTRYSGLNQITTSNVAKLKQVWSFSTGALRGHEGQPLVVNNTMYVNSAYPNHVYALDLTKEGAPMKWKYTPKQDDRAVPVACCDLVHRGVNYVAGKILMTTLDGQVIALDANTGQEVWKQKNADPTKGETMTMAGLVVKDKYMVGVSGGEFGVRGWLAAYNIIDGKLMWKAYSMAPTRISSWRPTSTRRTRTMASAAWAPTPGRASCGSRAAARRGAGTRTIRSSTSCTTRPATPGPGTPPRARATTSGR